MKPANYAAKGNSFMQHCGLPDRKGYSEYNLGVKSTSPNIIYTF